jgi:hypothetical protein
MGQLMNAADPDQLPSYEVLIKHRRNAMLKSAIPKGELAVDEEFHTCENYWASMNPLRIGCQCTCHNKMLKSDYALYSQRVEAARKNLRAEAARKNLRAIKAARLKAGAKKKKKQQQQQ